MIAVPPIKSIAIIGAGDGGCAAAAQLAQRGFDIRLCGRSRATTEPLSATGGIEYEGVLGEGFAPLSLIMCAGISTGPPAIFTAYVSGAVRREILGMLSWPST